MRNRFTIAALVLGGLCVTAGCDSKNETSTTPPPANQQNAVGNAVNNAAGTVANAEKNASNAAQNAVNNAQNQASAAASGAMDTAKAKLQQVKDYIAQGKLDMADSALKEVEGMKASLPQALQDQVTALRTQLDTAKAASGGGAGALPALPGK
jgi:vacuolar-type H+-ATPase subunit H